LTSRAFNVYSKDVRSWGGVSAVTDRSFSGR
jgi:hypothetical protein